MDPVTRVRDHFAESIATKQTAAEELVESIAAAGRVMSDALLDDGKILSCGNGGSAADAQHIAGELVGRFQMERRALAAIALSTDTSVLTAVGNDYSYDDIFARQVEALATTADLVFGISTSGNSPNVISAIRKAKENGVKTVGLLGRDGGELSGGLGAGG